MTEAESPPSRTGVSALFARVRRRLGRYRLRLMLGGIGVLVLSLLMLAGLLGSRALELGRRDLALIDLVRGLEHVSRQVADEAEQYLKIAPRDYDDYYRDTKVYYGGLLRQLEQIERLRAELLEWAEQDSSGILDRMLGGDDAQLRRSVQAFGDFWLDHRAGLEERLGPDTAEPRLEWGAGYLHRNRGQFQSQVETLSNSAWAMVEHHLEAVKWAGQRGILIVFLLATLLIARIAVGLNRRVAVTLKGCRRIAEGEFGQQIEIRQRDELTVLDTAVNGMSSRMAAVLKLLDRIQQSHDLASTLTILRASLADIDRVDWLALFEHDMNRSLVELRGQEPEQIALPTVESETLSCPAERAEFVTLDLDRAESDSLNGRLVRRGFKTAAWVLMPMEGRRCFGLLLASRRPNAFAEEVPALLENIAPIIAHGLDKTLLSERLLLATVNGLSKLAESRDNETGNHLLRMSHYCRILAESYARSGAADEPGWAEEHSAEFIRDVHRFAPMHDIGKVGIPDSILLKPGTLSGVERSEMNMHPLIGGEVLRACAKQLPGRGLDLFKVAIEIAECHHEKFDGSGYPLGLSGKEIPLSARIVAVADVFDALTSKRPYKSAWPPEKALEVLHREAGRHFDPELVLAFEAVLPRIMAIYHEYRHV